MNWETLKGVKTKEGEINFVFSRLGRQCWLSYK